MYGYNLLPEDNHTTQTLLEACLPAQSGGWVAAGPGIALALTAELASMGAVCAAQQQETKDAPTRSGFAVGILQSKPSVEQQSTQRWFVMVVAEVMIVMMMMMTVAVRKV